MLTNTYQNPAGVRCQRPPDVAYHVRVSRAKRLFQTNSQIVYTNTNKPISNGMELRSANADLTAR